MTDKTEEKTDEDLWNELEAADEKKAADVVEDAEEEPVAEEPAAEEPAAEPAAEVPPTVTISAAELHGIRSEMGRLRATIRKLEETKPAAAAEVTDEPTEQKPDEGQQAWDKFQEEYPEIAPQIERERKALTERAEKAEVRLAAIEAKVGPLIDDKAATTVKENVNTLVAAHPDWLDATGSKEFETWINQQPAAIIDIVNANGKEIIDPQGASKVLTLFKVETKWSPPKPKPKSDPKRDLQLEGARATRPTGGKPIDPTNASNDSKQSYWDEFERLDKKKAKTEARA